MTNDARENLEDRTQGSSMVVPTTLCRVTREEYLVNPEGYLLSHETREKPEGGYTQNINGFDQRSLPLVHPDEWEVIARMFAWHDYKDEGKTFRLLTFDSSQIDVREIKPHGTLDYGEYLGIVPESAIMSNVEYTWIQNGKSMNISRSAKENWPRIFALSEGYSPIPVDQVRG